MNPFKEVACFVIVSWKIGDINCVNLSCDTIATFLNQARAGRRPARAWFLRIAFVREVSMRVCVCVCVCVCVDVCVSAP